MAGTDLKKVVLSLLQMPLEDGTDSAPLGEMLPADSLEIVREVSNRRVAQIKTATKIDGLSYAARAYAQGLLFHTYDDFILQSKHATPTRTQGAIQEGDSLGLSRVGSGHKAGLVAYLAYLKSSRATEDLYLFFYRKITVHVPDYERERHSFILGKSGSGKTELLKLLLYGYLRRPAKQRPTLMVIEPHGDFAEQVAQWRENRDGIDLVYVDPFLDGKGGRVPTLNPLDLKHPTAESVDITAQALLGAFKEILQNASLTNQMEALLIPCLSVLLNRKGSTLADLMRFMDDNANSDLVSLGCKASNPAHAQFFTTGAFFRTTYTTTKQSLYTKLQSLLNSQNFYNITVGKSTLDITALLNSRKLIIFNLAKGRLGSDTSEAIGRFLLALIQSATLQRQKIHASRRVPCHCFIDEFSNYVSDSMEEILAESRKYKLHLTLAQQYLGQGMDTDFKRAVLANTQIKITGLNSNDTRAALAREMETSTEELADLKIGQFYIKVGSRPAWKLYAPRFLLGNNNVMAADQWREVKADQLRRYYHLPDRLTTGSDAPVNGRVENKTGTGRANQLPSRQDNFGDNVFKLFGKQGEPVKAAKSFDDDDK